MKSKNRATNVTRPSALLLAAGQVLVWVAPIATLAISGVAMAAPQGPQVVAGSAGFSQNGSLMTITAANRTIINYNSFNVARGETVRFVLPSGNSAVLNRVLGMMPSSINGSIQSNGIVYLVNPAGIIFGNGATINTSQFVAAAGNMSNADFLTGRNIFTGTGRLENYGRIEGATGVTLTGNQVANFGTIVSPQGSVVMAAGDRVLVGERQGRVFAQVTAAGKPAGGEVKVGAEAKAGAESKAGAAAKVGVENGGTVSAPRGRVVMGAGDLYATAIQANRGSRIEARSVEIAAPTESARPAAGRVVLSGEIDVRGTAPGERGGDVTVTGGQIALIGATIDASGNAGGGAVRVGGDVQGGGTLPRADATVVDRTSVVRADALEAGDGGSIVFWGDNAMRFFGTATARGGKLAGNGGMIETSGQTGLLLLPTLVDASSTFGVAGTWLIDPFDIEITTIDSNSATSTPGGGVDVLFSGTGSPSRIDAATLQAQLLGGTTVRVTTAGAGTETGNITVNSPISFSAASAATLELVADGSINFNQNVTASTSALNLTLTSGAGVNVASGVAINLNGGALTSSGTGNITMAATSSLSAGSVVLNQTGDVTLRLGGTGPTAFGAGSVSGVLTVFSPVSLTSSGRITATRLDLRLTDSAASVGSLGSRFLVSVANRISLTSSGLTVGNDVFFDNNAAGSVLDVSGAGTNLRTVDGVYGNGSVTLGFGGVMNVGSALRVTLNDTAGNISFTPVTAVAINAQAAPGGGLSLLGGTGTGTVNTGTATLVIGGAAGDTPIDLRAGGNSSVTFEGPVALGTVNVGGNLALTGTDGSVSRVNGGQLVVGGTLAVTTTTANDSITLRVTSGDQANITGAISLNTNGSGGNASITNVGATVLGVSTIGGNLSLNSGGSVTQTGLLTVTGTSTVSTTNTGDDINLGTSQNLLTGAVSLNTVGAGGDVTLTTGRATVLGVSNIGGNVSVAAAGVVTDSGIITVGGSGTFSTTGAANSLTLDQLAVTGPFAVTTTGSGAGAAIVNTTSVTLASVNVAGTFAATATTGGIVQSGAIVSAGSTFVTSAADQAITLTNVGNAIAGPISFTTSGSGGDVQLVNTTATSLGAGTVGGDLTISTNAGNITRSGTTTLTVGGSLDLSTSGAGGSITHAALAVTGPIRVNTGVTGGDVAITNATGVALGISDMVIGGTLAVTATTGNITDDVNVSVANTTGTSTFTATASSGNITLDTTTSAGAIGFNSTSGGAGGNVTYTRASGNAIIGTSDVGRQLTITTSAGSITTGTAATIRVRGTGTGLAATDNSVILTSRGSGTNGSTTLTGLRVDGGRLTANADQSISLTSTNALNISNIVAGELAGAGDLATPPSVLVNASSIGLSGGITTNRGDIILAGGPLNLLAATVTLTSRYAGSAGAGTFNNTSFGSVTLGGNVTSGGTDNQRTLVIRTPNGTQYAGGTASTTLPIVRFNGTAVGSASQRLAALTINSDSARINEPAVATIFAPSGLSIFTGGDVTFGQGERFTSGGSLRINAASATFGDLNVLGDATFNVPSVTVRRRTGAAVAFTNPSEILFDLGTDIVIGGTLTVSSPAGWVTSGSGERPVLASFSGSPINSADFTNVLLGGTYPSFADLFVSGSRPADFATGQTNLRLLSRSQGQTSIESAASELTIGALGGATIDGQPRFGNSQEATAVATSLSELGISLAAFRNGDRLVFERTTGRPMAGDTRSGVDRFTEAGLSRALATLKAVRELPPEASSQLLAAAEAFADVRAGGLAADPVGFAAFLAGRAEATAADAALTAIAAHFQALGELGLTPAEALPARELAVDAVAGSWADPQQRTGLIRAAESRRLGRLAQR